MGIKIKERELDVELELDIIINSIINTQFLKETNNALTPESFQIPYARTVYKWILSYFKQYKEAPNKYIKDIFNIEKQNLDDTDAELIEHFLESISNRYEDNINVGFCADRAIEYAKLRSLQKNAEDTLSLLKVGRIKEAENNHIGYKKIAKITSDWVNPLDDKYAQSVFDNEESDILIQFPGAFGELLGPLERGWFVSSIGEAKIGKSFFLHEIRTQSLFAGLKVVEINLEMKSRQLAKRFYQRITGYGNKEEVIRYPLFDCFRNQENNCNKPQRTSSIGIVDDDGMKLEFGKQDKRYEPCTACRGTDDFELTTWFVEDTCERLTYKSIQNKIKAHKMMYGDNFRLITKPRFKANLADIERDLDLLAYTEGFVPDVIVYDYADATRPTSEGRDGINGVWMGLAGMAIERNVLLATTSHVNIRRVEGKRSTGSSDVSDDTRKINHVDLMFAISQEKEEKRFGIVRTSVVEHRHKFFDSMEEVMVIRELNTGQSILDSERQKRGYID